MTFSQTNKPETYIICGNGPTLKTQLKSAPEGKIVRINEFDELDIPDSDYWVYYPLHTDTPLPTPYWSHEPSHYDFTPYLVIPNQIIVHEFTLPLAIRDPKFVLSAKSKWNLIAQTGIKAPTSGLLTIYLFLLMAEKHPIQIYTAGFDFYTLEKPYYYSDSPHTPSVYDDGLPLEKQLYDYWKTLNLFTEL